METYFESEGFVRSPKQVTRRLSIYELCHSKKTPVPERSGWQQELKKAVNIAKMVNVTETSSVEQPWFMKIDGVDMNSHEEVTEHFLNDDKMISLDGMCKKSAKFNKREQECIRESYKDEMESRLTFWQEHINEFLKYRRQAYDTHLVHATLGSHRNASGSEDSDKDESDGDDKPLSQVTAAEDSSTSSSMCTSLVYQKKASLHGTDALRKNVNVRNSVPFSHQDIDTPASPSKLAVSLKRAAAADRVSFTRTAPGLALAGAVAVAIGNPAEVNIPGASPFAAFTTLATRSSGSQETSSSLRAGSNGLARRRMTRMSLDSINSQQNCATEEIP